MSEWPVPTYLACTCSQLLLKLNLSAACVAVRKQASQSNNHNKHKNACNKLITSYHIIRFSFVPSGRGQETCALDERYRRRKSISHQPHTREMAKRKQTTALPRALRVGAHRIVRGSIAGLTFPALKQEELGLGARRAKKEELGRKEAR